MVRNESYSMEPEVEIAPEVGFDTLPPETRARSSRSANLLFCLGFLLLAGGLAFVFAPKFSWKLTQVARELSALGFLPGTLAVTGFVVLCLSFVARASSPAGGRSSVPAPVPDGDSDFMLVADQLATDLAQVLTSLLQMSEELAALGEGQRTLMAGRREDSGGDQQQNAVFRLAASVDKLNARVDQRFDELDTQLRSRIDSLASVVRETTAATMAARSSQDPKPAPTRGTVPKSRSGAFAPTPEPALPMDPRAGQVLEEVEETSMQFFDSLELETPLAEPKRPHAVSLEDDLDALDALLPDDVVRRALEDE